MRDKTRALEVQSAKVGLKINATKTKLIYIGTIRSDGVTVAGERVEVHIPWEYCKQEGRH